MKVYILCGYLVLCSLNVFSQNIRRLGSTISHVCSGDSHTYEAFGVSASDAFQGWSVTNGSTYDSYSYQDPNNNTVYGISVRWTTPISGNTGTLSIGPASFSEYVYPSTGDPNPGNALINGAASTTICYNATAPDITLGDYNGVIKGWYKRLPGGTWQEIKNSYNSSIQGPTLSSSYVSNTTTYDYRALVENPCSSMTLYSSHATVNIKDYPNPFHLNSGGTFCQNDPNSEAVITIHDPQPGVDYKLYLSGTQVSAATWQNGTWSGTGIVYETSPSRLSFDGQRTSGSYTAKASWNGSCSSLVTNSSNTVEISAIDPQITAGSIGLYVSPVCYSGSEIRLKEITAPSNGSNYTYSWVFVVNGTEYAPFSTAQGTSVVVLTFQKILDELPLGSSFPTSVTVTRKVTGTTSCNTSSTAASSVTVPIRGGKIISPGKVSDKTICAGSTLRLDPGVPTSEGTGTLSYLWQQATDNITWTSASGTNNQQHYDTPTSLSGVMYYRRRVTISESGYACDHSSYTLPLKITVTPEPSANPFLSGGGIFCQNDPNAQVDLAIRNPQPEVDYLLYRDGVLVNTIAWQGSSIQWSGYDAAQDIIMITESNPGSYTAKARWYNTCPGLLITIGGTVEVTPIDPQISGGSIGLVSSPVCYTDEAIHLQETLAPSGGSGNTYTYEWTLANPKASPVVEHTFSTSSSTSITLDFTTIKSKLGIVPSMLAINRRVTGTTQCGERSSTAFLSVQIQGGLIISAGSSSGPETVCSTSSLLLNPPLDIEGEDIPDFEWQQSTDNTTWTIADGTYFQEAYTAPPESGLAMYYRRKISYPACNQLAFSDPILVNRYLLDVQVSNPGTVCAGDDIVMVASESTNSIQLYKWFGQQGDLIHQGNTLTIPSIGQTTTYRVEGIDIDGCVHPKEVTVTVINNTHRPMLASLTKTASTDYQAVFQGLDQINYAYYWQTSPEGKHTNDANLSRTFKVGGVYYLRSKNTNSGCWGPPLAVEIPDLSDPVMATSLSMSRVNFVRQYMFQDMVNIPTDPDSATADQILTTTQYLDGLGRPIQTVTKQGTPGTSPSDHVQVHTYDGLGRESKTYLPYIASSSSGEVQGQPFTALRSFYGSASPSGVATSAYPLGYTNYEASPLNRVVAKASPGEEWAGITRASGHHDVVYDYRTNEANEVLQFVLSNPTASASDQGQLQAESYYPAGALQVTITYDENQSSNAMRYGVREYKDKQDRVLLKVMESASGELKTYYIYDDYNNLRAVIPPKASAQLATPSPTNPVTVSTAVGNELCFFYDYDARKRLTHKQVPGANSIYMVYDARDRLILTQDGNQRVNNEWSMTKYDGLNRPIITGIYTASTTNTQAQMQARVDDFMALNGNQNNASHPEPGTEIITGTDLSFSQPVTARVISASNSVTLLLGFEASVVNGELAIRIDNDPSTAAYDYPELSSGSASFPENESSELLTLTFYDDYSFDDNKQYSFDATGLDVNFNTSPQLSRKGQVTGIITRVLGTSVWLTSVNYYDKKGQVIQTVSENLVGGRDVMSNRYSFTGLLLESRHHHTSDAAHGSEDFWIIHKYEYDHAQRLLAEYQTIGAGNQVKITENTYNTLGELVDKALHQVGTNPAQQSIDYRYNIRGWLTHINSSALGIEAGINDEAGDYFGMKLFYTESPEIGTAAQYNGNIAAVTYQNQNQLEKQGYAYQYDELNRLGKAEYYNLSKPLQNGMYDVMGPATNNNMIQYDANGNIEHLMRYSYDNNTGTRSLMDDLSYTYLDNGNQLAKVDEAASSDAAGLGFKDGNNLGDDYRYDANGNMIEDFNKEIIQKIEYNYLNLPSKVMIDLQGSIEYVYDAAGTKRQKIVTKTDGKRLVTDYTPGMQYHDKGDGAGPALDFIVHSEGRAHQKADGSFVYDYDLKDHLGNTRVTFTTEVQTDVFVATMESERRGVEENDFENIAESEQLYAGMNATPVSAEVPSPRYVATLNAAAGRIAGPTKVLYVAKGDVVDLSVKAKYKEAALKDPVASGGIVTAVAAAFGITQSAEDAQLYNAIQEAVGGTMLMNDDGTGLPHAYLNYILFTTEMQLLGIGAQKITLAARVDADNPSAAHEEVRFSNPITISQPGFMYIYVSNESSWDVNVYFDDLTVSHTYNGIIQTEDYYPFGLAHNQAPNRKYNNRYLYQGKELQEETETYDFHARMYDPALGRTFQQDPMGEMFYGLSSYSWAANNPISYIDPTGMVIEEGSQKEWDKQKGRVERRRDRLEKRVNRLNEKSERKGWSEEKTANRIGNKSERVASLNSSLETMGTLETSSQVYALAQAAPGENGGVTLNTETNAITISYGNTANFVHETTHAGQFETGDVAFDSNTGATLGADIYDEVAGYKAQFAYSPSSVSGLSSTSVANSFGSITPQWVQGLAGGTLYVPGGSANTGVSPLNINSTRSDFIKAFPNNAAIKSLPANFILKKSYPSIYYKR